MKREENKDSVYTEVYSAHTKREGTQGQCTQLSEEVYATYMKKGGNKANVDKKVYSAYIKREGKRGQCRHGGIFG